jgi:serine/threonine protein kinase
MDESSHAVLLTGTELGPYVIESRLGTGGMGEVYRARDKRLRRTVALKVLSARLASTPGLRQRLERAGRARPASVSAWNARPKRSLR